MEIRRFLQEMHAIENLKNAAIHSWTSADRRESVAEHSWRMTMMAYLMKDEFPEADIDKVIRMRMIHGLGEAVTGDIPTFAKTSKYKAAEAWLLNQWVAGLPEPSAEEMSALYAEMKSQHTVESKLYKAIDKMEALIQHNESDISTWILEEYTLNLLHGEQQPAFLDYMKALKAAINEDTKKKLSEAGIA